MKQWRMITKGIKQLIAEAELRSKGISVEEAKKRIGDGKTVFVDIRDVRELEREGMIPDAFHAPRGMLEFWVDPESPYFKPVFTDDKTSSSTARRTGAERSRRRRSATWA